MSPIIRRTVYLFLTLFSFHVHAAETVINTGIPAGGAEDLLYQTKTPEFKTETPQKKVITVCKDSQGNEFKTTDVGYEDCAKAAQSQSTTTNNRYR